MTVADLDLPPGLQVQALAPDPKVLPVLPLHRNTQNLTCHAG
jgi:hypothetical protein